MINFSHIVNSIENLKIFLFSDEIQSNAIKSKSILIQVFSSEANFKWIEKITKTIESKLPTATIIGVSTAGEISKGSLLIGKTVISFTFFDTSSIKPIAIECSSSNELKAIRSFTKALNEIKEDIKGVLLLPTPLSMDVADLINELCKNKNDYPIFGGGAGVYDSTKYSMVFCGKEYFTQGIVAIAFYGKDLNIYTRSYLGWQPLSKEMTITDSDGMYVKTIDNINAFEIYSRYIDIENDDKFFQNVLEFPFLLERNGDILARTPLSVKKDGTIKFLADINKGEKFRIGYGNPENIIRNVKDVKKTMCEFQPDAIFLYTCICRRFLMQNDINLETRPFDEIAPTTGFYTYGEIYGCGNEVRLLNSTMLVIGMREGDKKNKASVNQICTVFDEPIPLENDPFANKHSLIISRLVHFINKVTEELEEVNKEITKLSEIDKLTQIYNRLKLDASLQSEIFNSKKYNTIFSVILMDLDYFKLVNDMYGHNVGDDVLIRIAKILQSNVRIDDVVGRWGGEEFLIVLPNTKIEKAYTIAEHLRRAIDSEIFPLTKHQTVSLGVASFSEEDTQDSLLIRADKALYEAKNSGRNKVVKISAE
jgi:diguanylate cyclase (GGDEF)-like protein